MSYLVRANICVEVEEAASDEEAKLAGIEQLSDYFRHNQWVDLLTVEKLPEEIRDQMMPAPDEAPLTSCPWCGAEYNVQEDKSDDLYDTVAEETPGTLGVYRHKACGRLVRFVPTGADVFLPDCPNCDEPLTEIWGSDHYKITLQDGRWHKEEDASRLCCGKCQGDLEHADCEEAMRAVGLL